MSNTHLPKILLVEDDGFKERNVEELIHSLVLSADVRKARSVVSCIRALEVEGPFALVVLDMSLPTYDVGKGESGFRPQGFGGQTVLQHMDAAGLLYPVVVVTQFERFGEAGNTLDLKTLSDKLQRLFPEVFLGLIFYSASGDHWRVQLGDVIRQVFEV